MLHELTIQKANDSDAKDILKITQEAFTKYKNDLIGSSNVKALKETEQDVLADLQKKHVIVAKMDDVPVGCARFEVLENGIVYFSRFGVLLSAQSLGVGGQLVGHVVDFCKKNGHSAIALHTSARMSSLIRFYYGKGFFIHSINDNMGYYRALLIKELKISDEIIQYNQFIPENY